MNGKSSNSQISIPNNNHNPNNSNNINNYSIGTSSNLPNKTNSSLENANRSNQLARDAAANKKNQSVVGRNNLSSISQGNNSNAENSSSALNTNRGTNYFRKQNSAHNPAKQGYGKRTGMNLAKKMPGVLGKAATGIDKINSVNGVAGENKNSGIAGGLFGNRLRGMFSNMLGFNRKKNPSDLNQTSLDDNNQDDEDGRVESVNVISRANMIRLIVGISLGSLVSILLIAVFVMGAMVDTGGQGYLASHDNPSVEDLNKAYNAQN